MENTDLRTIDENVRYELRKRAIALLKSGKKKYEIAQLLSVNKNTITNWSKSYSEEGVKGLKSKSKSNITNHRKLLSSVQEKEIQKKILDKMPDQLKLPFALWTRKAVKELIEKEFKIVLALSTTGDYLRKWGYTPQKPKRRAYEQCPKKVQKWLNEEYPEIKKKAIQENAEIHWGDETGASNQCNHGRSYAPKGKTPVKKYMAKKFSVNMISSVTNQGKVQFMLYTDKMNSDKLIEFMQRLIKTSEKKIYLILDNLRVHHSKKVKEWEKDNKDDIALFYLPSYSPERNPDEYLNCDLKQGLSNTKSPETKEQLKENIEKHMKMLSNDRERVKLYFKHEDIKYAS